MNFEYHLQPFYIMSLPWNPHFSYEILISSLKRIHKNPKISRGEIDELIDFNREGDTDVYEFLQIPYFKIRSSKNGYRATLNLSELDRKTEYLRLTEIAKELLEVESFQDQIKILFLIICFFYPQIRALLEILFSEKIFFKSKKPIKFPLLLEKYFIESNNYTLVNIIEIIWTSDNNSFLKSFINNEILLKYVKGVILTSDFRRIKPFQIQEKVEFLKRFREDNKFNNFTSKACASLLGLSHEKERNCLYDIEEEGLNLYSIKLKEELKTVKFFDFSMKEIIPINIRLTILEEIDQAIMDNYSLNTYYTLQEIMYDLEKIGFKENDIIDWKQNIEKKQISNNTFESILLKIETRSGVMSAMGLRNQTQHAKLKFLKKVENHE